LSLMSSILVIPDLVGSYWRGALIFEEPAASVKKRKREMLIRLGWPLPVFVIWFIYDLFTIGLNNIDIFIPLTYLISILMMFVFFFFMIRSVKPLRFYENGVEYTQPFQKTAIMPYSDFDRIEPPRWYRPRFYALVLKRKMFGIQSKLPIPANIDGLPEKIDIIASRIANPPVSNILQPVPTTESRRRLHALEIVIYLFAYLLMFLTSFVMVGQDSPPGATMPLLMISIAFAGASAPMMLLLFAQYPLNLARNSEKFRSDRLFVPGFSAILIFCMISSPIAFYYISDMPGPTFDPDPGASPSFSALPMGNYSDMVIHPQGDILVDDALSLRNVTLVMRDEAQIWVMGTGELRIHDSFIMSNGTFKFRSFGQLLLNNTTITNLWGYVTWPIERGGIEVYGGNATIADSIITGGATRGLMVSGTGASITNCTITGFTYEGVVLVNSPSVMWGNTISGSETGILVWNSTGVIIEENIFSGNEWGISLVASEATINNNTFMDNDWAGIDYDAYSNPTFSNNTFRNNADDILASEDSSMLMCGVIAIIESVIVMGILIYQSKKLRK